MITRITASAICSADASLSSATPAPTSTTRSALSGWSREKGVQTLCVHGDNPRALAFVKALRSTLERQGFTIRAFGLS